MAGIEYAVDMVCYQGHKKTTAIWQYRKPTGVPDYIGYDAMVLLPYSGRRQNSLQCYAAAVLDSLDIRYGPAHCELMWVGDGPVLVEVGRASRPATTRF